MKLVSRSIQFIAFTFGLLVVLGSCKEKEAPTDLAKEAIIPKTRQCYGYGQEFFINP
ncbi:MAG: hypothetical protein U5K54_25590 [Cytophagales bacterium]|nr:hypothetical protein [Cytophagales bacterium]